MLAAYLGNINAHHKNIIHTESSGESQQFYLYITRALSVTYILKSCANHVTLATVHQIATSMCVKEFLGYNCGHCSIPYLRQCPLTESNPIYPPCKFPAERPIFTNENCHACARVLWNKKVLEEEAQHRLLHENGSCECEVIFDSEERGRRMRPRGAKGKGKMKEIGQGEYNHGHDHHTSSAGDGAAIYQGHKAGDDSASRTHRRHYPMPAESSSQRQDQEWEAKLAAYEYLGYFVGGTKRSGSALGHVEKGHGFPEGGYVSQEQLWEGQLRIGQPGGGMKWYPEQGPALPNLPALPPIPAFGAFTNASPRIWQRASSEPTERSEYSRSPNDTPRVTYAELKEAIEPLKSPIEVCEPSSGPIVVSSDMAKTVSQ